MNPKIAIAVDAKNRAVASMTGMVTVGAKVDVEITGLPSGIADWGAGDKWVGKSVRFRVVDDAGHDLVRFPLVEKSGSSATDGDKWTVVAAAGGNPETYKTSDGTATSPVVEFDTDGLRRKMACVPFCECREFGVIIDSIADDAQYAVGKIKVRQWATANADDPTVLPDWRETLDKLNTDLAAVDASKAAAAASASSAASSATTAGNSATLAGQYADAALGNKNAAVAAKNAAEAAQAAAAAAALRYPYIDGNGHWKVWENGAWADKGAAKGDKGDTGDVEQVLAGETMSANPTQRQIATAVKKIWTELGGTVAAVMLALSAFGDVTRSTEWQDVPPNTTLGTVVDLGGGGGGGISAQTATNISNAAISEAARTNWLCTVAAAQQKYLAKRSGIFDFDQIYWKDDGVTIGGVTWNLDVPGSLRCMSFDCFKGGETTLPSYLNSLAWRTTGNRTLANYGITNAYTKAEADGRYLKTNGSGTMSGALVISDDIIGDAIKYGSSSLVEVNINGRPKSNWFNGGCDYADEANALTMKLYGSMPNGKVYADALGNFVFEHRDGEESNLTPDGSPVATSNMVERIATNFVCHTNPRFSNEVLAVGLGIGTNEVAQINAILAETGGTPVGEATTVGGLLAALALAVAWLKRKTASIEATVGTANGDLADALGGNS